MTNIWAIIDRATGHTFELYATRELAEDRLEELDATENDRYRVRKAELKTS